MRDRHDRGRTGAFPGKLPYYRTSAGKFERLTAIQMRRLWRKDSRFGRMVEVQIQELPPFLCLESGENLYSAVKEGEKGGKFRIVLYSRTLAENCADESSLNEAIEGEMVLRLAEIFNERPEDIDPDFGFDS
ncbi:MAG: peptidase [Aeriscardovia sp.]|nr:peptidase [Aeriscardovia sp.]